MKKILFCSLFLIIGTSSFSKQIAPFQPIPATDYVQKSKFQKTAAWLLLAGGTRVFLGAVAHDLNNLLTDANSSTGLYLLRGAMVAGLLHYL
jgi:hypothetical protein